MYPEIFAKFNDLQDFAARMIIVADEKCRHEFDCKMGYVAFPQLADNKRVSFLSYESLGKQHKQEFEKQQFEFVI